MLIRGLCPIFLYVVASGKAAKVTGRSTGYPSAPPTDPDLKVFLIRFLGNQSLDTTLAHNFAALQAEVLHDIDYSGFWERKLVKDGDHELFPVNVAFMRSPA